MKTLLTALLLLGCSGPAFTGEDIGQENNSAAASGGGGEAPEAGNGGQSGGTTAVQPTAGNSQAGASGAATVAGGPAMGEGGAGGSGEQHGLSACLGGHQTLECARVCDSSPYCQGILDCFVSKNSDLTSDCPGFSDTGYELALRAERECCK